MSDAFTTITGKVVEIGDVQTVGAKGFKKRLLVVQTQDKYPATLATEWSRDLIDAPMDLTLGDVVRVEARIDGRAYNGKYYTTLIGRRVEPVESRKSEPPPETVDVPADLPPEAEPSDRQDTLPF